LDYYYSVFIHIFHDTNGHLNNLLLVDFKAFVASSVHGIACDFTNPVKLADLKLLHHITIPENSILHRCGYFCIITADQVSRGYKQVTKTLGNWTVGYKCLVGKAKQVLTKHKQILVCQGFVIWQHSQHLSQTAKRKRRSPSCFIPPDY